MNELALAFGPTGTSLAHHEKGSVMPARVVVVHDDQDFADRVAAALGAGGHDVAVFPDPLVAWDALEAAKRIDVLVARVEYPPGKSNGLALARMARSKRPQIKILFTALPQYAENTVDLGEFLPMPVSVEDTIEAVTRLLDGQNKI
jgi:DNA-binding NtrC family response regulator